MALLQTIKWILTPLLAAALVAPGADSPSWKIDPSHSEADFAIKHMAISTVHGTFRGVSGTVHFDPDNIGASSVDATIDVKTVNTGVDARDGHLRGPEFFEVEKYPTMTFKSTSVKKMSDGYDVYGDLTIHGVSRPVTLRLETPGKPQMDAKGLAHCGFTATTMINRKDFGLLYAQKTTGGDAMLGDDVKIELNIEAIRQ
jgi:polyisoprenoid-binding protein YceI